MKVKDLIERLSKLDPEHEVMCFDPESGLIEKVTGMTYGGRDNIVELFTDDPND